MELDPQAPGDRGDRPVGAFAGGKQMRPISVKPLAIPAVRRLGIRSRALALISVVALLTFSLSTGVAAADGSRSTAENTFTKWITTFPAMAGVVGGDVGAGTYAGEILKYTPGNTTVIEALYHFNGSRHSFTALVHVEQTGLKAVISGVVTAGWLKGRPVEGRYTQITCTQSPNGACFQGSLDILPRSGG
jgi:hypothetical protein